MAKLKILHLIPSLKSGGAENQLVKIVPKLTEFEHKICCLQKWGEVGNKLDELGIANIFLDAQSFFDRQAINKYRELIKEFRPNFIITYLPFADFWGRFYGRNKEIKIICSLRSTMKDWRYRPLIFLNILTHRLVDYYLAVSHEVKKIYIKYGLPGEKIKMIYSGIEINKNKADIKGENVIDLITKMKNEDGFLIGYVARLRKEKGHMLLFKTIKQNLITNSNLILLLIGDGPEEKNLKNWVKKNNLERQILFLGYQENVTAILELLDIYLHASLYEGLSNSILEAMSAGCAILAIDIPENREILKNGEEGFLVDFKNKKHFYSLMENLIKDKNLRDKVSEGAKKRILNFSLDKSINELNKFLQNL